MNAQLKQRSDCQTARKYWNKLKARLKLTLVDVKNYLTDVAMFAVEGV